MVIDLPAGLLLSNQPALEQNLNVLGNSLPAAGKMLRKAVRGHGPCRQQGENIPSGRIGNGNKYISSHGNLVYLQPYGCKYTRNRLVAEIKFRQTFFLRTKEIG